MRRGFILCPAILTLTAAAGGGPLRADRLPADAAWVVHADLERASTTKLGRFVLGEMDSELAGTSIGQLDIRAGVDVRDVTLFGWADEEPSGIFLATMTGAADRLFEHVAERTDYERHEHDGQVIHSWLEHTGEPGDPPDHDETEPATDGDRGLGHHHHPGGVRLYAIGLPADRDGGRLFVATDSMDSLLRTIRVIGDEEDSRADLASDAGEGELRLPVEAPADAFFFIAATDPHAFGEHEDHANIAKLAEVVMLNVGERDGEGFVNLSVSARTEEEATQIAAVLQGMAAFAQLSIAPDDEELAWLRKLVATVAFTADGMHVTAGCRFDPEIVIEAHDDHDGEPDSHGEPDETRQPAEPEEDPEA